jgi:hypothetical protein
MQVQVRKSNCIFRYMNVFRGINRNAPEVPLQSYWLKPLISFNNHVIKSHMRKVLQKLMSVDAVDLRSG